ncbi:MAG: TraB/GumN family protein [Pseudomonadota bacterium]
MVLRNEVSTIKVAIALVALILSAACVSVAEENVEPSAGPALWRVADDDTVIYIFGAADALPPEAEWRSDAMTAAFASADMVVLETDDRPEAQAALGPVIQEIGVYRDGRTLSGILSDEQKAEIGAVTAALGAPLQALDALKPWLASIQIGALNGQAQGYQTWSSGLSQIGDDARAMQKPVIFLEPDRSSLLRIINALPEETHVNMLVTAARQTRDRPTQAAEVVPYYLAGDVDALAERYHGEGQWADETIYKALLVNRNQDWADKIQDMLAKETGVIFFAVGTGHVLGDDSLQLMLIDRGLSVTRQ